MMIEIDDIKLHNMEEDMETYINVIKQYDKALQIKQEIIKLLEAENKNAKKCIEELLKMLEKNNKNIDKKLVKEIKDLLK